MTLKLDAKPVKCRNCGKPRGEHKAVTLNCPTGMRSRIGYLDFSNVQGFEPKRKKVVSSNKCP